MKNIQIIIFFVSGLIIMSCKDEVNTESDFYSLKKEYDLWRVPLLEPYEIVSPNNADDWFLIIEKPNISGPNFFLAGTEFQFSNITQIGIIDSVIVLENVDQHWTKLSGMYPSVLIVNAKTKNCFIYSKEHHSIEIQKKLDELGLIGIQMISWKIIKDDFQQKGLIPAEWKN